MQINVEIQEEKIKKQVLSKLKSVRNIQWKEKKSELKKIFEKNERNEEELKKVLMMIKNYNIISDCYKKAEFFINLASNSLSIFDESKEKEILKNLTSFSLERSY